MSFLDALLTLSDAQALTGTVAILSTNVLDTGNAAVKPDLGVGEPITLQVSFDAALGGTTPGITVEILQSAAADMSSPDVLASSGPLTPVALGRILQVPFPGGRLTKRYVAARYTMTGTTPTATVTSSFLPANMSSVAPTNYPKGYTA